MLMVLVVHVISRTSGLKGQVKLDVWERSEATNIGRRGRKKIKRELYLVKKINTLSLLRTSGDF